MPRVAYKNPITVYVEAVDGFKKTKTFKSWIGAHRLAVNHVGPTPEFGMGYAVAPDGVVKVMADGISLRELFGDPAGEALVVLCDEGVDLNPLPPPQNVSAVIMKQFMGLVSSLSPENLSCDGELAPSRVRARYSTLMAEWRSLEKELGRAVEEEEVWAWYAKKNGAVST